MFIVKLYDEDITKYRSRLIYFLTSHVEQWKLTWLYIF